MFSMLNSKKYAYLFMLQFVVIILLVITFFFINCNGESEEDEDCTTAEEIWGTKDASIGDECSSGSYGTCSTNYNNCIEGSCKSGICTKSCTSQSQCTSYGLYCSDSYCKPAAVCHSYNDGYTTCSYHQDPNDPTKCVQGTCIINK